MPLRMTVFGLKITFYCNPVTCFTCNPKPAYMYHNNFSRENFSNNTNNLEIYNLHFLFQCSAIAVLTNTNVKSSAATPANLPISPNLTTKSSDANGSSVPSVLPVKVPAVDPTANSSRRMRT